MKLRKIEIWLIGITLAFLALTVGFHLGDGQDADMTVSVSRSEAEEMPQTTGGNAAQETRVNINTAGAEELITLDGIGEAIAARIIAYREEHGPFQSIREITNVEGIGAGKFEAIREHITVS